MARNGSGTYSRVNTFIAGATITAAGHNQNWADLENEMTNSVAADGQTTMTGPLKHSNGSVAAPSITFGSDTDTGFYRKASNTLGVVVGGVEVGVIGSTGFIGLGSKQIGEISDYAGTTAPSGHLFCRGQSLLRTDYPDLFTAIGTSFGAVDGTHFSLPDIQGRTTFGLDVSATGRLTNALTGGIDGTSFGSTGGNRGHTLDTTQIPSHAHSVTDPGHQHQATSTNAFAGTGSGNLDPGAATAPSGATDLSGVATSSQTTGISIQNTGGGAAHNNVPPGIVVNKIIFTGVA